MDQAVPLKTPAPLFRLLLVLSATTGMVDAVSILGMDKVFTANMTGNVVFLAFATTGAPGFHPLHYIVALGAFMAGAAIAGRLWRGDGAPRLNHWLVRAAAIESCLLFLAGLLSIASDRAGIALASVLPVAIALTAGAMGFRNAVVRQIKVPDLTTTVLTLTITGIASDSRLASGTATNLPARLGAVVAIFAGAAAGALLFHWLGLALTLLATGAVVLVATMVFVRHPQMAELQRK
jgi:Predicted membrane protein